MRKILWQPSASAENLKNRAEILKTLRDFFYARHITEVETPLMCSAGTTDVYLDSFLTLADNTVAVDMSLKSNGISQEQPPISCSSIPVIDSRRHLEHEIRSSTSSTILTKRYLQTSPEFAMKRLLAAGIGDCYQICKAFRVDEIGKNHNPEFTMLEWYRLNFDHHQLMDDMDALLQVVLKCLPAKRVSYQRLFLEYLQIDPHTASIDDLINIAPELCAALDKNIDTKDDYLMLLLSHLIEPNIGFDRPCFIYDFPATQAALSKINNNVAQRFEVYVNGIELANGFHELQHAEEQLQRFEHDNKKRRELHKPEVTIDYRLIEALKHGLPNCAGVALGVDRLIMLALQQEKLGNVISFSSENC